MRKFIRLALLGGLMLCALLMLPTVSLADSPISTQIECKPSTLTGPGTVQVSINVANIGDDDLPGTVKIIDPGGNTVASTQLLMQQSFPWQGEWRVTQDEFNNGRFSYKIQYQEYDESGSLTTKTSTVSCKFTKKAATPEIKLAVQLRPENPIEGQQVTVDMIIRNVGSVDLVNLYIVDKELGITKNDLTHAELKSGDQATLSHSFTMGADTVASEPVCYFNIAGDSSAQLYMAYSDGKYEFKPAKVSLSAMLSADKQVAAKGDKVELTCVITNDGEVRYDSLQITDPTLGTVAKSVKVGAGATVTEKCMVEINATTSFRFELTGTDSSGNPVTIKTNEISIQTLDDVKPANLRISIDGNRDIMYAEKSTGIFMIKVENLGEDTVENIDIYAADVKVTTIDSIQAGQEEIFAMEFTLSMGGKYQFFAKTKDLVSNEELTFESNVHQVLYQAPAPTPSPTPTLTPTPSPSPTPEPTLPSQLESQDEGGGFGQVLLYILAGLLVVIIGGVVTMFVLDRYRTPPSGGNKPPRGGNNGGGSGAQVIDRIERSSRRDYSKAPNTKQRSTRAPRKDSVGAEQAAPDQSERRVDMSKVRPLGRSDGSGAAGNQRVFETVDINSGNPGQDWREGVELLEPELPEDLDMNLDAPGGSGFEPDVPLGVGIPARVDESAADSHLVAPEAYQDRAEYRRPVAADDQDGLDEDPLGFNSAAVEPAPEDAAMRAGSDGQYHLSRRNGSMRPKASGGGRIAAEDPASYARKQRAYRGREMNTAQFYEDDEESGGDADAPRRRRRGASEE